MKILISIFIATLLFSFSVTNMFAEETGSSSAEVTKVDPDSIGVDYQLAYPGLLPDHPLYFLKAARDRINAFFISNPVKKAEFDLLQADKRVAASLLLVQKNKIEMSKSTFSKAENYFEDGLNRAHDAKIQGVNISELAKKLVTANRKHQEVLRSIKAKMSDKNNKKFVTEQTRLIELGKRAKELSK